VRFLPPQITFSPEPFVSTRYRVSVCRGPDCTANGSNPVYAHAQKVCREEKLDSKCDLRRGGCYGLCHLGPNVVVRQLKSGPVDPFDADDFQLTFEPGEVYYWKMRPEDVERVLKRHVGQGQPVPELVGDPDAEGDFRKKG
jgi:(2Fe-2S) ferredoxin